MNLSYSEGGEELASVSQFQFKDGALIHTPCSEKDLPSEKRKKRESLSKCLDQGQMYRTFQRDSAFSTLSICKGIYSKHICHGSLLRQGTNISPF